MLPLALAAVLALAAAVAAALQGGVGAAAGAAIIVLFGVAGGTRRASPNPPVSIDQRIRLRKAIKKFLQNVAPSATINVTAGSGDGERKDLSDALQSVLLGLNVVHVTTDEERRATADSTAVLRSPECTGHLNAHAMVVILAFGVSSLQLFTSDRKHETTIGYTDKDLTEFTTLVSTLVTAGYRIVVAGAPVRCVEFQEYWTSVTVETILDGKDKIMARAGHQIPFLESLESILGKTPVVLGNTQYPGESYVSDWSLEKRTDTPEKLYELKKFSGKTAAEWADAFGVTVEELPQAIRANAPAPAILSRIDSQ